MTFRQTWNLVNFMTFGQTCTFYDDSADLSKFMTFGQSCQVYDDPAELSNLWQSGRLDSVMTIGQTWSCDDNRADLKVMTFWQTKIVLKFLGLRQKYYYRRWKSFPSSRWTTWSSWSSAAWSLSEVTDPMLATRCSASCSRCRTLRSGDYIWSASSPSASRIYLCWRGFNISSRKSQDKILVTDSWGHTKYLGSPTPPRSGSRRLCPWPTAASISRSSSLESRWTPRCWDWSIESTASRRRGCLGTSKPKVWR